MPEHRFHGQNSLFEVMTMNEDMRKALIEKASLDRIRTWRKDRA